MAEHCSRRTRPLAATGLYGLVLVSLLFSTVSVPRDASIYNGIGRILSGVPGVSVVSEVGTYQLTQARYSTFLIVMPLAAVILLFLIVRNGARTAQLRVGVVGVAFTMFALVAIVSALLHREYVDGLKLLIYALAVIAYGGLMPAEKDEISCFLLRLCVVAGMINSVVTLLQYAVLSGGSFNVDSLRVFRPDGVFGDSILSALFSIVTITVIASGSVQLPTWYKSVVIALCLASGVATGARTFYYLLVIVVAVLLTSRATDLAVRWKLLVATFLAALLFFLAGASGSAFIDSLSLSESSQGRDLKRQLAMQLFVESPLFGIGTGQYSVAEASIVSGNTLGLHGTNPHNVYLQVLAENGLLGFVPFIVGAFGLLGFAVRRKDALSMQLIILYLASAYSLGLLYSLAFTVFLAVLINALLSRAESARAL